jgi:hypothetical protein
MGYHWKWYIKFLEVSSKEGGSIYPCPSPFCLPALWSTEKTGGSGPTNRSHIIRIVEQVGRRGLGHIKIPDLLPFI